MPWAGWQRHAPPAAAFNTKQCSGLSLHVLVCVSLPCRSAVHIRSGGHNNPAAPSIELHPKKLLRERMGLQLPIRIAQAGVYVFIVGFACTLCRLTCTTPTVTPVTGSSTAPATPAQHKQMGRHRFKPMQPVASRHAVLLPAMSAWLHHRCTASPRTLPCCCSRHTSSGTLHAADLTAGGWGCWFAGGVHLSPCHCTSAHLLPHPWQNRAGRLLLPPQWAQPAAPLPLPARPCPLTSALS